MIDILKWACSAPWQLHYIFQVTLLVPMTAANFSAHLQQPPFLAPLAPSADDLVSCFTEKIEASAKPTPFPEGNIPLI